MSDVFINEFTNSMKNIAFYVMYGQTEATARLTYLPPVLIANKLGSIGKDIPGVSIEILDAEGKQIKPGEIG